MTAKPVFLDYMATAPVDPVAVEEMVKCLGPDDVFGNPSSSSHLYGWQARELVENARAQVADLVNADPREMIWTSGATESDNLAIKGVAEFYQRNGKHIITMNTEHKAVLSSCQYLETQGFDVTYLAPMENGVLDLTALRDAIRDDTILISIMQVNNETGVIQDIERIGQIARENGVLFHVDAAQSAGKLPIDLAMLPVDLMSFSGHKCYGPKGIGALYVRRKPRVHLVAQMSGGKQERGMRSGTLATHQIVGMGAAFAVAKKQMAQEHKRIAGLRDQLWQGLQALGGVILNGDEKQRVCGALNVHIAGVEIESLLLRLTDVAISTGSACNSASVAPSHVLKGMGLDDHRAHCSMRFSVGRFTTAHEIERVIAQVTEQVQLLRSISPMWEHTQQRLAK